MKIVGTVLIIAGVIAVLVCTENLNPGVVMMKSAEYRV